MKKMMVLTTLIMMVGLTGCGGKEETKVVETESSFVESIEVEEIEVEQIDVEEIEVNGMITRDGITASKEYWYEVDFNSQTNEW